MSARTRQVVLAMAVVGIGVSMPSMAWSDPPKRVGGHVGFVVPLASRADGTTTTVADDFVIGFPTGFGLKKFGKFALDLEVVPVFQNEPQDMSLELHPGVVYGIRPSLAAGVRLAVDVEGHAWGFTPLLNRTLYVARTHSLFGEVVMPVRYADAPDGTRTSVGVGVHIGVGF